MRKLIVIVSLLLPSLVLAQRTTDRDSLLRYHPKQIKPSLEKAINQKADAESLELLLRASINLGKYFYADSIYDLYFDSVTAQKELSEYVDLLETAARLNKIQQRNNLSLSQFQKCLDYYRDRGDWQGEGRIITRLAEFYRSSVQYEDAQRILKDLIDDPRFEELNSRTKAAAYHRLAAVYIEGFDNPEACLKASRNSLYYSEANGDLDQMATSYLEIGYAYYNRDDARCIDYFRRAKEVWQKLGYGHYIGNAHLNIASYFIRTKQVDSAEYHLDVAIRTAQDNKLPGFLALLLSRYSELLYERGDYKRAFELRDSAAELRLADVRIQFDMDLRESVKKYQYDLTLSKLKTAEQERKLIAEQAEGEKQSNQFLLGGLIIMTVVMLLLAFFYQQIKKGNAQLRRQAQIISEQNQKLSHTIGQKDLLLKEVHHRVKNNLQMIISLLEMQEMDLQDQVVSQAIQDSILRRVSAMALVHEHLYSQQDLEYLQADEYLSQLVAKARELSNPRNLPVIYKLEFEPCSLSIEKSVALGMICSELISNSYKYAFSFEQTNPVIRIKLQQDKNDPNLYSFYYIDNGKGLAEADSSKGGLGTKLIEIFAKQLEAEMEIFSDGRGYQLHLKFYRKFES